MKFNIEAFLLRQEDRIRRMGQQSHYSGPKRDKDSHVSYIRVVERTSDVSAEEATRRMHEGRRRRVYTPEELEEGIEE